MRQALVVKLDGQGCPCAEVPLPCMWDLVEYLSFQRVAVTYEYHASHFTVTFTHSDEESARRVLDEWAKIKHPEMQSA